MFSPKADARLQVQIPAPADDRPSWTKVGVIAAIGFLVGIGWPRVVGVRLGPAVPADVASAGASASASPGDAPALPNTPSSAPASAVVPAVAASPAPTAAAGGSASAPGVSPTVTVGHGFVFACKTSDGDALKGADCGTLSGLDTVVTPRLRKLAECSDAASAHGKLHLVMHVDFPHGGLSADLGKGQTVSAADGLLACVRAGMGGASLAGITHENPRYSVAYTVTFDSAGSPGASTGGANAAASAADTSASAADSSTAQVVWEVAIVRDAPKTGKVLARLQRGTAVHLGAIKDGWYPVKYGDGFANDGWLYRGAVGH